MTVFRPANFGKIFYRLQIFVAHFSFFSSIYAFFVYLFVVYIFLFALVFLQTFFSSIHFRVYHVFPWAYPPLGKVGKLFPPGF